MNGWQIHMDLAELERRTDHMIYDPFELELLQHFQNEDDNAKWEREMYHNFKDNEDVTEGPHDMIL